MEQIEVLMHIDSRSSSRDRLDEEVAPIVEDVVAITSPYVVFSYEDAGESAPEMTRNVVGAEIVRENVRCGRV